MIFWNLLPNDTNSRRLYHNTYMLALENIAKKYNISHNILDMPTNHQMAHCTFQLPDIDDPIIFISHHPLLDSRCEDYIYNKCPKAKIIMCGGDTVYYGLENVTQIKTELFIETIKEQVRLLQYKTNSTHIYWTLSQNIIDDIIQSNHHRPIQYDAVCLCQSTALRRQFFTQITNLDHKIIYGMKNNNFDSIYNVYRESKFAIGITSPAHGFSTKTKRSMKGMRDWIAPYCETVLIYDDFDDILDIGYNIVPTYKYNDGQSCHKLMSKIQADSNEYNCILRSQQKWIMDNTMEKQLENIFIKHQII